MFLLLRRAFSILGLYPCGGSARRDTLGIRVTLLASIRQSHTNTSRREAKRALRVFVLVGTWVGLALPGTWAVSAGPASANSIGSTQTTIAQLENQIATGAARIHHLTEVYGQAELVVTNLTQQIQANATQERTLSQEVASSKRAISREAIASYTGSVPDAVLAAARDLRGLPQVQAEYLNVADNNLNTQVQRLRLQAAHLADVRITLKGEQQANVRALHQAAAARQRALRQAGREQAELNQDQSRLAALQRAAAVASTQASPSSQGLGTGLVKSVSSQVSTSTTSSSGEAGGVWLELRECESGDNYQENTGNGFYGAYQFSESTWLAIGYTGYPNQAAPAVQDAAAKKLQAMSGWGQWPACSAELGLT